MAMFVYIITYAIVQVSPTNRRVMKKVTRIYQILKLRYARSVFFVIMGSYHYAIYIRDLALYPIP